MVILVVTAVINVFSCSVFPANVLLITDVVIVIVVITILINRHRVSNGFLRVVVVERWSRGENFVDRETLVLVHNSVLEVFLCNVV